MSQYPPPFQPPQGPLGYPTYNVGADLLRPARIASVMLWILGGLGMLCGVCASTLPWVLPLDRAVEEARAKLPAEQLNQIRNVDLPQFIRILFTGMGVLVLVASIVLLCTAGFVWRGRRGAAITAMVECILIALCCLLGICLGLLQAASGVAAGIGGAILWLVVGIAFGVTIFWLARALRVSAMLGQNRQYPAQYMQYMQQQAGLGQGGYGYGYGPPGHAPPPVAPPPAPAPPPPGGPQENPHG